jgi:hypothetical protein
MQRNDNEINISAWSPDWIDGSGVRRIAEWYLANHPAWQPSEIFVLDNALLSTSLGAVRTSEYAQQRSHETANLVVTTPVIYEIHRLRGGRSGPMEERIVEHALSVVPCQVGLHAVDIRRPLPDEGRTSKRGQSETAAVQDALRELRALRQALPLAWAICSTAFSRGPSVAELYRKQGSRLNPGMVYVSKAVRREEVAAAFHPAHVEDVGSGYEVALTKQFGGFMDMVSSHVYEELWKVLRKVSITGLPWDALKALDR